MLRRLDSKPKLVELPYNLRELLIAEDVSNFPESRFFLRSDEKELVDKVLSIRQAAEKLSDLGIAYLPALLLHGESGTGKTMLARYIAYKSGLPFVYVRFSSLIGSLLGSTQSNIAKIFDYARCAPCVLCLDEIDSIGMARGQNNDVGEMNRIVVSVMQELDCTPNGVIVVGTTNRYDRLDAALVRRFTLKHEVPALSEEEIIKVADIFYKYTLNQSNDWVQDWCQKTFGKSATVAQVTSACTDYVVDKISRGESTELD